MPNEQENSIGELEEKKSHYRKEVDDRIKQLLETKVSLLDIVSILGAEKFLIVKKFKGKAQVYDFDVKGFVDEQIKNGTYIRLPYKFINIKNVILPPGEGEIIAGSGTGVEKKQIFPRDKYLVEILTELGEPYFVVDGVTEPNMVRQLSYKIFIVPHLERIVYVNNEEGNASFVIYNTVDWEKYAFLTKDELKTLPPQQFFRLIFRGSELEWKARMMESLAASPVPSLDDTIAMPEKKEVLCNPAPEGWATNRRLAIFLGVADRTVARIANEFRPNHPEWFSDAYLDKTRNQNEHYHPDLVLIISERLRKRKPAPEGWMTNGGLANLLETTNHIISKIANEFRPGHPEWFSNEYVDKMGRHTEHYHPDLVLIISERLRKRKPAPEGWATNRRLAIFLGVADRTVARIANEFRPNHPEWFSDAYLDKTRNQNEHYHPDLVLIISERLRKRKPAPEGWMTNGGLANLLETPKHIISKIANEFRPGHPEWFSNEYVDKSNHFALHYHPELVAIIKKRLE